MNTIKRFFLAETPNDVARAIIVHALVTNEKNILKTIAKENNAEKTNNWPKSDQGTLGTHTRPF